MKYNTKIRGVAIGALVLLTAQACGNRTTRIAPESCGPFDAGAALNTEAMSRLAGDFDLVVSATSGGNTGATATGELTLMSYTGALRSLTDVSGSAMSNVVVPYYGTSNIDMNTVGAVDLGPMDANDPQQPGVLVVQSNTSNDEAESVVMRMGSDANVRGATPFDGGYTVLRVRYVSADTLLGNWASGTSMETAAGYFCAVRH